MKRFLLVLTLFIPLGCGAVHSNTPPAAIAPAVGSGYIDKYDQQFAQDIAAAEKYYRDTQNNISARTYVPSPTELTALNAFGVAINVAKAAAKQYKVAQTSTNLTSAQNSVNSVKSQQTTLAAQISTGGK